MKDIKLKKIIDPNGTTDYKRCHYKIVNNELPKLEDTVIGQNCMRLLKKLKRYKHPDRRYKEGFIWRLRNKGKEKNE